MRKTTSLSLVLAAALGLSTLAIATPGAPDAAAPQHGWHGHAGHGHFGGGHAFAKLNLTDAQKANIKQIMRSSFAQNKGQWQALRDQRKAFDAMTPDQVGYQAAAARLAQTEGDATRARIEQRAKVQTQIYAVLTPAQKAQLQTMRADREARREQWKQFKATHPAPGASTAQ